MGGKIAVSPSVVTRTIDNTQNIARLSNAMSYVVNGNKSIESGTIPVGSYVRIANSTISGRADGIYTAKAAIPANTTLDASYFNESVPIPGGLTGGIKTELTNLNSNIIKKTTKQTVDELLNGYAGNSPMADLESAYQSATTNSIFSGFTLSAREGGYWGVKHTSNRGYALIMSGYINRVIFAERDYAANNGTWYGKRYNLSDDGNA